MEKIQLYNDALGEKQLNRIIEILKDGDLIIIPTDTLYAIACDALNPKAIEKVCRLKGINPEKTNLSILCNDISMVSEYARFDNYGFKLLKENTPGPFTFLFRAASSLPRAFKGRKTVGVRIPACECNREIIARLNNPLLSTSINFNDEDFGRNPELIAETYEGKVQAIIIGDEGSLSPSAIIDCTSNDARLLREGPKEIIGL